MKLEFIRMQATDLDPILAIENEIYPYPWTHGNFLDSLKAGHHGWIARCGDTLVGYCLLQYIVDEAHLLNISIAKPYQGKGLGRALLDFAVEASRQHGSTVMLLEVRDSNIIAQTLYHAAGFNRTGERKHYYPAKQGREHAVLMELLL
ncbi:ribosomal-protein-alanine N-acetyltransferase [Chitinivorax tropicus]|uniref:[Ribosomal protein bS18]-alanine N-acetyltransferase n=1 Tax=Chitinivorax tropicus TaxID=714531 RepID=A0A840MRQ1_9PROT|nr:ribosomal protein S18-alanine N-acetyltransferase [Chitinivorax tropicus]MBB5019759.1 ribosomal-protein-alanine N-acetyltransferase [Chitinivorax tropicus]